MEKFSAPPKAFILRLYRTPLAFLLGRFILLLTTHGRKSGLPRVTPLQYEKIDHYYCLGQRAACSQIGYEYSRLPGCGTTSKTKENLRKAEVVTDPQRIADFLELRLKRHPTMVGKIMEMDGLSHHPGRAELEAYAGKLAMVIIHPISKR
jgi:hypothetical protein